MYESTFMFLWSSPECHILYHSLEWGPRTAAKSWQQKIYLLSKRPFFWRNFTLKESQSIFCSKMYLQVNWYYLNNSLWVQTLVYKSETWTDNFIKSTMWICEKVDEEMSISSWVWVCVCNNDSSEQRCGMFIMR